MVTFDDWYGPAAVFAILAGLLLFNIYMAARKP